MPKPTTVKDKPQIVCIDWIDASIEINAETYTRGEARECDLCHGFAVGVLVDENKNRVVIARDWFDNDDSFRGVSTYPKSGIKKITRYYPFKEAK